VELVCLSFIFIIVPLWKWIVKENNQDDQGGTINNSRWDDQERERVVGTFIFLDAMSHGSLLPPPEDTFPMDEQECDDFVEEEDDMDRYRDNEY